MAQSITSNVKQINSQSTVVNRLTTPISNLERLPNSLFAKLKAQQHAKADEAMRPFVYRVAVRATMHELINCCDKLGYSRAAQQRVASRLGCSLSTVQRHYNMFVRDGLIAKQKTGWKHTNLTTLLFLQHWKFNKDVKMNHYLTPSEAAPERKPQEGLKETEKRGAEEPFGGLSAQEQQNWDDYIPASDEVKSDALRKMREMLSKH